MEIKTEEKMPFVPLSKLRRLVKMLRAQDENMPIRFDYLMTALFPTIYQNIQSYVKDAYTSGYLAGLKAKEEENEN